MTRTRLGFQAARLDRRRGLSTRGNKKPEFLFWFMILAAAAAWPTAGWAASEPAAGPASAGDAVVQGSTTPGLTNLKAVPTVFFVREGDGLRQILDVSVENGGPEVEAAVAVSLSGREIGRAAARLKPGPNVVPVRIPEAVRPVRAKVRLVAAGAALETSVALAPQRKWNVYLFHHSHTDIGYTDLQSRIFKNHAAYLDSVIDYCRETDGYPDDAKFRWNIEVSWALENYLKTRPESKIRELVDRIMEGRVELSGIYLQLSDCFAHEELVRAVGFAREAARRYGFDVRSAMNNDVTGYSWALPQIYSRAGIRYFATGINETRSRAPLRRPNAFWWESPDGSRILHWNGEHYLFGNYELQLHEGADKSAAKVGDYLRKLEARGDYPQDLIAFNVSAWVTDNCPPGRALSDRVKDWNERFAFPKLRLATMREFFTALEAKAGATLPVHKLAWPDYWTDGVGSTAFETAVNRRAHNELLGGEAFAAAAALLEPKFDYPAADIHDGYDDAMLYDEHTWGGWNSISDPQAEFVRGQWAMKSVFAYRSREAARSVIRKGTEALAALVPPEKEPAFAVFNALSWPRTDVVRVALPQAVRDLKGKFRIVDRAKSAETKFQMAGEDAAIVLARDVPPLGYATYVFVPGEAPAGPAAGTPAGAGAAGEAGASPVGGSVIENAFYRVTVDPKAGGLASVYDKELGRELVDLAAPYALNTYVYENPEGGRNAVDDMKKRAAFKRAVPSDVTITAGTSGPVATSLVVKGSAKGAAALEQTIVLYNDIKRLDLVNRLDKIAILEPEAVYFAFPFAVKGGAPTVAAGNTGKGIGTAGKAAKAGRTPAGSPLAVRFEIADADMAPETEQLPGTTRDWHTVQHWTEFSGDGLSVVWSPREAPLVQFGDINTGKWLLKLDLTNAWVFSYAMNNYWMTNFKASQDGRHEFAYAITSRAGGPDRVASSRFGAQHNAPLETAWIPAGATGGLPASGSFFAVDRPNVILQTLKVSNDGRGLVVRLREIGGQPAEVRISAPLLGGRLGEGSETDIVEESPRPLPAAAGGEGWSLSLKPFEIRTFYCALAVAKR